MSSFPNLAEILGKINDGICVFTSDREISFKNEKAEQILNAIDDVFQTKVLNALRDRSVTRFEHFHTSLNRWFEHHTYPNADGGLTVVSCDITSRRRMEEALRASEERFRRLIDSNVIGVIVVENGVLTEANEVFLGMVGYSRSDVVLRHMRWREMTPAEFDHMDAKARVELESTGGFAPYEKDLLRHDGSRVPVIVGGVAINKDSHAHETLCLVLDLTERRRAEDRVRAIVECGKILASSLECETTFPELAEFIVSGIASACFIFVTKDGRPVRMTVAQSTAVQNGDLDIHVARVLETGESQMTASPVSQIAVPIVVHNQITGVLVAAHVKPFAFDAEHVHLFEAVGRRAGLALENSRLYHEVQRANRLKDEFVAIVSHELRTPLTPILGGVYMIRSEPHDEKVFTRALDLIERNAKTQVKIVDDLLDVSRALSGKLKLNMESVDLSRVIQAAVETVRPAGEAKGIRIEVQLEGSGTVSGDADRLQQVVWNLLANAVKFTPNAGHIVIELSEDIGHAEIRVTDTGIGIEPEFLPHVFEKFRQANTSRTRPHGGLGLGLAIVRHLVESHGGTVQAQSSGDEQGSTFVVRIPLRSASQIAAL